MVRAGPEPLCKDVSGTSTSGSPLRPFNVGFTSTPSTPSSASEREVLQGRLMASEDNETRLRAELASLRSSHSALQAQVKMALLSEASSEGERSRQVENLETTLKHERGVRQGLEAKVAALETTIDASRRAATAVEASGAAEDLAAARAESKALRERVDAMQQRWEAAAAAASAMATKTEAASGADAEGAEIRAETRKHAELWAELAQLQREATTNKAALEKATTTEAALRRHLEASRKEVAALEAQRAALAAECKEREAMEALAVGRVEEVVRERDDRAAQCRGWSTQLDNLRALHATLVAEVEGGDGAPEGLRARAKRLTRELEEATTRAASAETTVETTRATSGELEDARARITALEEDVRKLPMLTADNKLLAERAREVAALNAELSSELRKVREELAEAKAARESDAAAVDAAGKTMAEIKLLETTVVEQMELITFQKERADIKDRAAAELARAGERKDAEIHELRFKLTELEKRVAAPGPAPQAGVAQALASVEAVAGSSASDDWARRQWEWNQKALKRRM